MNHLRELIVAALTEHGEGLLNDEGIDQAVAGQIAEKVIDATPWVTAADYWEIHERLTSVAKSVVPLDPPAGVPTNNWIDTRSGKRWYITDPREQDVDIMDIAHALSLTCRFGGHCAKFYSVAEHCVRVMLAAREAGCAATTLMWALLHDSAEAYLGDMVGPLKRSQASYKALEGRTEEVILRGLGLPFPTRGDWEIVKRYDTVLLMTELRDLFTDHSDIGPLATPLMTHIAPMSAWDAKGAFVRYFVELRGQVKGAGQ